MKDLNLDRFKEIPLGGLQPFGKMIMDISSQEPWRIPDKVAIIAAPTGAFFNRQQNPNQPYTADEIIQESIGAVEAGACSIHIHVRDDNGFPSDDRDLTEKVVNSLRERFGKNVHIDGEAVIGNTFEKMMEPIQENFYESAAINCFAAFLSDTLAYETPQQCQATAQVLQEAGKGIILAVYNAGDIDNANRWLLKPGIVKHPYVWGICPGLPGGAPMWDPISMTETLVQMIRRIKEVDGREAPPIVVTSAGRGCSHLTTLAILLGCHVRVGMEDTIYRVPHKNDVIESNRQAVEQVVAIAELLGRKPMTADEYRKAMG